MASGSGPGNSVRQAWSRLPVWARVLVILLVAAAVAGGFALGPLLVQHPYHRHRPSPIGLVVPMIVILASVWLVIWTRRRYRRASSASLSQEFWSLSLAERRQAYRAVRRGTPSSDPDRQRLEGELAEHVGQRWTWLALALVAGAALVAAESFQPALSTTGRVILLGFAAYCLVAVAPVALTVHRARRFRERARE
jgi:hypothetical protein